MHLGTRRDNGDQIIIKEIKKNNKTLEELAGYMYTELGQKCRLRTLPELLLVFQHQKNNFCRFKSIKSNFFLFFHAPFLGNQDLEKEIFANESLHHKNIVIYYGLYYVRKTLI